jgi:hypothetical protein
VRWVSYWSCFLLVVVAQLWVRCLKAFLGMYLRLRGKSMNLRSQERVEQMIISLNSKLSYIKEVMLNSSLLQGVALLGWVCLGWYFLSACVPSGLKQKSLRSQTPLVKEEPNGYSDSSPTLPRKNQSLFLLDTSPLWEISPSSHASWDFILARPQEDE